MIFGKRKPCPGQVGHFARTLEGGFENNRASEGTGSGAWRGGAAETQVVDLDRSSFVREIHGTRLLLVKA